MERDIIENVFEEYENGYDKFSHIIICNISGNPIKAVPYIYVRNIPYLFETINTAPKESYPEYGEYAIKNVVLCINSLNPHIVCSLIERREKTLLELYQELRELEQLDMLDEKSAKSLSNRLIIFMKMMKLCNTSGKGIFWLPENYMGDGGGETINTDDEDSMRKAICKHIKHLLLPMARIIPSSDNNNMILNELLNSLDNYNNISNYVASSHFAPILRNRSNFNKNIMLKTLMAEEFRCVKNEEYIDGNNLFIFNESHMKVWESTVPNEEAHKRLQFYTGYYLKDLDLSKSFITGSSITASLINTSIDYDLKSWEDRIELLYPKVLTQLNDDDYIFLKHQNITLWDINAVSKETGIMTKGDRKISFSIKEGSDVDIAVDNTVSDEEYQQIAFRHFEVIKQYYPYVKIQQHIKPKGDWNYTIYTDDPLYIPIFRTVEIYRSSFRNICSHHVGSVRGCFTSRWSDSPQFYITASAMWTSLYHATPNYHYFAGRKSTPQDIIIKNIQRGINISDEVLCDMIKYYTNTNNIEFSPFPFYRGFNVPYSVFSASIEWPYIQKSLLKEQKKEKSLLYRNEKQILRSKNALEQQRNTDLAVIRRNQFIKEQKLKNEEIIREAERASFLNSTNQEINIPHINLTENIYNLTR